MHVITPKRLKEFAVVHPDAGPALDHWYRLIKGATFQTFVELRDVFLPTKLGH